MRILILICALCIVGCSNLGTPRLHVSSCGSSDYAYTMVGLQWGCTNSISSFSEEDYLMGDGEKGRSGSGRSGGSSGSCSSCGDKR